MTATIPKSTKYNDDVDTGYCGHDVSHYGGTRIGSLPTEELRVLTDYGRLLVHKTGAAKDIIGKIVVPKSDIPCGERLVSADSYGCAYRDLIPTHGFVLEHVSSEPFRVLSAAMLGAYGTRVVQDDNAAPEDPSEHLLRAVDLLKTRNRVTAASALAQDATTRPVEPDVGVIRRALQALSKYRRPQRHATMFSPPTLELPNKDKWDERIATFRTLKTGWDSYRAEPPTESVLIAAMAFLQAVRTAGQKPTKLNPSVVGGVGFTFRHAAKTLYIEFRNTGNAHAAFIGAGQAPEVVKVNQDTAGYAAILAKAEKYLYEQNACGHESKRPVV